jgi:transcription-repair coupling factor (superfamily II helicase)
LSIHSLHKISRYAGKEGSVPKIYKLGSKAWKALKQKTKKKVKEIAFDLIELYAKRRQKIGFAFDPDSYLQWELEASFLFEDTPDQEKSNPSHQSRYGVYPTYGSVDLWRCRFRKNGGGYTRRI